MNFTTLTISECETLLQYLRCEEGSQKQNLKGLRNQTMALLMLDSGLRCGELKKLKVSDLLFNGKPVSSLVVRPEIAKGHRQRTLPLTNRVRNNLFKMDETWWNTADRYNNHYAFYDRHGSQPITRRQIERIIKQASLISIGRPVHPHLLRHTFGTKLMRLASSRVAQELLGHKNLTSTQIYQHPNHDDLKSVVDRLDTSVQNSDPDKL